ncbi:MAG: Wzz/FepE/Etk N-terminal domain-containing protein [Fibrobacterota bacterium]|nr:Wzz/FepE/Etk N-terminal domain-containing protein [Fibrobacterota bacterium]
METKKALEIDLPSLVKAIYRRKTWVLAAAVTGLALGFAHYKLAKRLYSSTVVFTSDSGQNKLGRMGQFAMLTGGLDLGGESSPYLTHIEKYAESRELSDQLRGVRRGDSTLTQILVKGEVYRNDTSHAFHGAVTSLYTLKKDADGLFSLEAKTSTPEFSRFLADSVFAGLDKNIREKKRQNTNKRLEFVNSLVDNYHDEMKTSSDRVRNFLAENLGASSPALLQKRGFLTMDQKLAEEKYLMAVKQREELRVQMDQRQDQLVVIEPAYVPLHHIFPTKLKSVVPAFALLCILCFLTIAYLDRKAWIYPV